MVADNLLLSFLGRPVREGHFDEDGEVGETSAGAGAGAGAAGDTTGASRRSVMTHDSSFSDSSFSARSRGSQSHLLHFVIVHLMCT